MATPAWLDPNPEVQVHLDRELARRSYHQYVRKAWPHVEVAPFSDNWHIGATSEHLQAVSMGQIKNLLVNTPPGSSKSLSVAVFWPTWEWGPFDSPELRGLFVSYDQQLSTRDALRARQLLTSPWYRERWPEVLLKRDQDEKTHYANTKGGYRISTSIGGHGTGQHPNRIVCDDPHNVEMAESDEQRKTVLRWWRLTISARGAAADVDVRKVVVMQRLHEGDLSGHILAEEADDFVHLCLPMRWEPKRMVTTPIGWQDPRTTEGELLDPKRYPPDRVDALEKKLGMYGAAGQMQQRPAPAGGGEFQRSWWRYYDVALPLPRFEKQILSFDTALTDTEDSAMTAGGAFGQIGSSAYVLGISAGHMSPTEMLATVTTMAARYPLALAKLVEFTASGPWLIALLKHRIPGMIAVKVPRASKLARARVVSPLVQAGNVLLPGRRVGEEMVPAYPWVADLIDECASFPNGVYNDRVDMLSQALTHLEPALWREYREELERTAAVQAQAIEEAKPAKQRWSERLHAMTDPTRTRVQAPMFRRRHRG